MKWVCEMEKGHFFASSVGEWRVDTDLVALVKYMKRHNLPFNIWYVPLDKKAPYEIRWFAPQVEGVVHIGFHSQKATMDKERV